MMKIDDCEIPQQIVDAFCRIVEQVPDQRILELSKYDNTFFRNHRVVRENIPTARKHLKETLKTGRPLLPGTRDYLINNGLYVAIVMVLSERALELGFKSFASYFGIADFLAAALLDDRQSVRNLAHDYIERWDGNECDETERQAAKVHIQSEYKAFLDILNSLIDENKNASTTSSNIDHQEKVKHLQAKCNELEQSIAKRDRQATKDLQRLQELSDNRAAEIEQLKKQLESNKSRMRESVSVSSQAQQELDVLNQTIADRIKTGVAKEVSSRLRHWLRAAEINEQALTEIGKSDLLTMADRVLEKQREADRKYGNIAELNRTLATYNQKLEELTLAQRESLQPLPQLSSLVSELKTEISRLKEKLGINEPQQGFITHILSRINEAESNADLYSIRRFVQSASDYEFLDSKTLRQLYKKIDTKAGLLYDQYSLQNKDERKAYVTPYFHLPLAIENNAEFLLLIDGHNVLFTLEDIFGIYYENGYPAGAARRQLANSLLAIFTHSGGNVRLYFDGDERNEQTLSDQVRVIYSGGKGEHRADNAIIKDLGYYRKTNSNLTCCLVTKDSDLAAQAHEMGAISIAPEEFAVLFEEC